MGLSAAEILAFYRERAAEVFGGAQAGFLQGVKRAAQGLVSSKYSADGLRGALTDIFGSRILGQSKTRLVIPAFSSRERKVYVFKTAHHPRFEIDLHRRVVDVALATAAAPTYFPAHSIKDVATLIDGGVWANNPTGLAAVEAVGVLKWPGESLRILSIGCTEPLYTCPDDVGLLGVAASVKDLFMQGQSLGALGTAKLLCGHSDLSPRLWRYSRRSKSRRIRWTGSPRSTRWPVRAPLWRARRFRRFEPFFLLTSWSSSTPTTPCPKRRRWYRRRRYLVRTTRLAHCPRRLSSSRPPKVEY